MFWLPASVDIDGARLLWAKVVIQGVISRTSLAAAPDCDQLPTPGFLFFGLEQMVILADKGFDLACHAKDLSPLLLI